ncbi:MAG: redoxin domain-containing protein [Phycisphaerales bacterium]|nr:redoxin domain-containing protein [Phycisphaerales bacterium]
MNGIRLFSMCVLALATQVACASTSIPVEKAEAVSLQRVDDGKRESPLDAPDGSIRVVVFGSVDCPVANASIPEVRRVHSRVQAAGGGMYFVHPVSGHSEEKMARHAKERTLAMPILHDPGHALVTLLDAKVTPEAFVLRRSGSRWLVVYRGPLDNLYADIGSRRRNATRFYVQDALVAAVAKNPVETPVRAPIGCFIERKAAK